MMPSYKVEFSLAFGTQRVEYLRPLACEQCEMVIGEVSTARTRYGMTADAVARTWPIHVEAVRLHERECRAVRRRATAGDAGRQGRDGDLSGIGLRCRLGPVRLRPLAFVDC